MPRGYLKAREYRLTDLRRFIEDLMSVNHMTQTDMARLLGITQGAFSKKLSSMNFNAEELLIIFQECKAEPEKVGRKMVIL